MIRPVPRVRIAVLVSGHGSNLQALLEALKDDAGAEVALVISNRPDAGALERARQAGVTTALTREDGQDASGLLQLLRAHAADLVVLAGYLKRVPDAVVAGYRNRILNVHPALLPAFGGHGMYGRRVHLAVLASGMRITGATVHLVDEQYDHGRILAQWPIPVMVDDTPETLAARVLAVEHRLLPAVVRACAKLMNAPQLAATGDLPSLPILSLVSEGFVPTDALPPSLDHALTTA
ncbi:MAG: phosphoribosylglycinamide formyltransferase [Gemmatimonadetes bacterium]|nr:phosphoribosylglycinamide formyltransferase [Gemmatimonadota bacterium]